MAKKPPQRTRIAVQDDRALMDPEKQDKLLDQLAAQKVKQIRANAIWGAVRTPEGEYDFSKLDGLVDKARQRGIQVQMTIVGTPAYMKDKDQSLSYNRADPKMMAQFSKDIATHFKGRVRRYSMWNEPNHDAFLEGAAADPKAAGRKYRDIYRAGYGAVKGVDPGAQVLIGEMTSQPRAREFLTSVLAGKPLKTAGVAYHPYQTGNEWDLNDLGSLQKSLGRFKRQGRLQTAKGKTPGLFLTEFGHQRGQTGVTEERRTQLYHEAQEKAERAGARQMTYYQLLQTPPKPGDPGDPGTPDTPGGYGVEPTPGIPGRPATPAPSPWWDTSITADGSDDLPSLFGDMARRQAQARLGKRNVGRGAKIGRPSRVS